MFKKPKRPRDFLQAAKLTVEIATGQVEDTPPTEDKRNPLYVKRARAGGLVGGKARAEVLTKEQRSKIAKKAAKARWKNHTKAA